MISKLDQFENDIASFKKLKKPDLVTIYNKYTKCLDPTMKKQLRLEMINGSLYNVINRVKANEQIFKIRYDLGIDDLISLYSMALIDYIDNGKMLENSAISSYLDNMVLHYLDKSLIIDENGVKAFFDYVKLRNNDENYSYTDFYRDFKDRKILYYYNNGLDIFYRLCEYSYNKLKAEDGIVNIKTTDISKYRNILNSAVKVLGYEFYADPANYDLSDKDVQNEKFEKQFYEDKLDKIIDDAYKTLDPELKKLFEDEYYNRKSFNTIMKEYNLKERELIYKNSDIYRRIRRAIKKNDKQELDKIMSIYFNDINDDDLINDENKKL